jgi:hypothetical protein
VTRPTRALAAVLLALLAAQFLLGMITNLYAPIPPAVPGLHGNLDAQLGAAARWALLHGPPELKIHVAAGLAIGVGAISLAVLSLRPGSDRGAYSPCSACSRRYPPASPAPHSSPTTKTTCTPC